MERLRIFERKCLRACLNLHRDPGYAYNRFHSNKTLLNKSNISRIDCLLLKLSIYYFHGIKHSNNPITEEFSKLSNNKKQINEYISSGCLPPEASAHIDRKGLSQDSNNVPILHHINRHYAIKTITHTIQDTKQNNSQNNNTDPFTYNK